MSSAAAQQVNVMSFCYLATLYLLEKSSPKFQVIENIGGGGGGGGA